MKVPGGLYDAIQREAAANGIDPLLIAAVCYQEGGLQPYPPDGDGGLSHGPMQLHRQGAGTGRSIRELRIVDVNVRIGAAYLAEKVNLYPDDLGRAITAYNWPARAIETAEPSAYARAVLAHYSRLQAEGIERDPPGPPDPTPLELIDTVWGALEKAARARRQADRRQALAIGQGHLLRLKAMIESAL